MSDVAKRIEQAASQLQPQWSDAHADLVSRAMMKRRRRRAVAKVALGASVAACIAAAVAWYPASLTPQDPEPTMRLADGSSVVPLSTETVVSRVPSADARSVTFELVRGGARFDVVHDTSRTFRVIAGPIVVEDLGTVFTVEHAGALVEVEVRRGSVRVQWEGGSRELGEGQRDQFPKLAPEPPQEQPSEAPPAPSRPPRAPASSWRSLAQSGSYDEAWQAMHRPGAAPVRSQPEELLLAADVARLSGHPAEALAPLRRLLREHRKDPRAPLAAFTLGRVLLEELGRPREAGEAFVLAQALDPDGALAEDASSREVECWSRAGDAAAARAAAERYLQRFPNGARAKAVRRHAGLG
jgi:transmembrane sensor